MMATYIKNITKVIKSFSQGSQLAGGSSFSASSQQRVTSNHTMAVCQTCMFCYLLPDLVAPDWRI